MFEIEQLSGMDGEVIDAKRVDHGTDVESQPGFWQAGENAAGMDDPAWKESFPFVTFDELDEETAVIDDSGCASWEISSGGGERLV